jgi:hypothetical protein
MRHLQDLRWQVGQIRGTVYAELCGEVYGCESYDSEEFGTNAAVMDDE